MKYLLIGLALSFGFALQAGEKCSDYANSIDAILADLKTSETANRGCCSYHNGVCGCSMGVVTCCDGTDSPSCRCN